MVLQHDVFLTPTPQADPPVKTCGCGEVYTAEQWEDLVFLGMQQIDFDGHELELRRCKKCRSSLMLDDGLDEE